MKNIGILIKNVIGMITKTTMTKVVTGVVITGVIGGSAATVYLVSNNDSEVVVKNENSNDENKSSDDMIGSVLEGEEDAPKTEEENQLNELEDKVESGEITEDEFKEKVDELEKTGNISVGKIDQVKKKVAEKSIVAPAPSPEKNDTPSPSPEKNDTPAPAPNPEKNDTPAPAPAPAPAPSPEKNDTPAPAPAHKSAGIDWNLTNSLNAWVVDTYAATGLPRYSEVADVCKNMLLNGAGIPEWLQNGYEVQNGMGFRCFGSNSASITANENGDLSPRNLLLSSGLDSKSAVYVGGHAQSNIYYVLAKHDGNGNLVVSMEQLYVGRTH